MNRLLFGLLFCMITTRKSSTALLMGAFFVVGGAMLSNAGEPLGEAAVLAKSDPLAGCSETTPTGCVTKNVPGKVQEGFTFIDGSVQRLFGLPGRSTLIDKDGNIVKEWSIGSFVKLLPGGNVLGGMVYESNVGSGMFDYNDCFVELDWEGNIVWPEDAAIIDLPGLGNVCDPNSQVVGLDVDELGQRVTNQHHDHQREGNPVGYFAPGQEPESEGGKTLILSQNNPPLSETSHISNFPLFNDIIVEFEVDDERTEVLWEWDPIDHFEPGQGSVGDLGLGFSDIAKEAIKTILVVFGTPAGQDDWMHINSVSYVGPNRWCPDPEEDEADEAPCDLRFHPDNVIWNARNANIIAIVARHDHPNDDWKSGDIVWRVGPDYGDAPGKLDQIIGIHHAHMIPQGLPGAGNILVFDNGGNAADGFGSGYGADENGDPAFPNKFRSYSRIIEFDPVTLDVVWSYERPGSIPEPGENFAPFFSPFGSGMQRLENGNTLISEALTGRMFEVTSTGELVWEFVNPFGPFPPYGDPSQGLFGIGNLSYRAYRIPLDWIPEADEDDDDDDDD